MDGNQSYIIYQFLRDSLLKSLLSLHVIVCCAFLEVLVPEEVILSLGDTTMTLLN